MTTQETAWIAGYLEGEGSFRVTKDGGIEVKVASTDQDVIERARGIMGSRRIHGPYLYTSQVLSKKPYFSCWVGGQDATSLMAAILPLMGARRAGKISACLAAYHPVRIRGRKPTCHPDREHRGLGLCGACYSRLWRSRKVKGSV